MLLQIKHTNQAMLQTLYSKQINHLNVFNHATVCHFYTEKNNPHQYQKRAISMSGGGILVQLSPRLIRRHPSNFTYVMVHNCNTTQYLSKYLLCTSARCEFWYRYVTPRLFRQELITNCMHWNYARNTTCNDKNTHIFI